MRISFGACLLLVFSSTSFFSCRTRTAAKLKDSFPGYSDEFYLGYGVDPVAAQFKSPCLSFDKTRDLKRPVALDGIHWDKLRLDGAMPGRVNWLIKETNDLTVISELLGVKPGATFGVDLLKKPYPDLVLRSPLNQYSRGILIDVIIAFDAHVLKLDSDTVSIPERLLEDVKSSDRPMNTWVENCGSQIVTHAIYGARFSAVVAVPLKTSEDFGISLMSEYGTGARVTSIKSKLIENGRRIFVKKVVNGVPSEGETTFKELLDGIDQWASSQKSNSNKILYHQSTPWSQTPQFLKLFKFEPLEENRDGKFDELTPALNRMQYHLATLDLILSSPGQFASAVKTINQGNESKVVRTDAEEIRTGQLKGDVIQNLKATRDIVITQLQSLKQFAAECIKTNDAKICEEMNDILKSSSYNDRSKLIDRTMTQLPVRIK